MSYNLRIGNAKISYDSEENECRIVAEEYRHDNAPHDGSPTDFTNERWPSYVGWSDFCNSVGLRDLFFNEDNGLIINHPGVSSLNNLHKKEIDKAYINFKKKNLKNKKSEANYNRLKWLKYWVDWCLKNCDKPILENS